MRLRREADDEQTDPHQASALGAHLILTGYGHWAPNDPRGSGSEVVAKPEIEDLGPIHHGRKRVQPSRDELRAFHREFEQRLDRPVLWFNPTLRDVIAEGIARVIRERGYTCYACAVLRNHAHMVMRTHRDDAESMNERLARTTRDLLLEQRLVPDDHPIWSGRPYKVFLNTRNDVLGRIDYVEQNPMKEGLPRQTYAFVTRCSLK